MQSDLRGESEAQIEKKIEKEQFQHRKKLVFETNLLVVMIWFMPALWW